MTTRQLGEEGFRWFVGIVADLKDPAQLGRVRIRVLGMHDDTANVSDEDLPWAQVMVPATSASLGGVGLSPVGIAPDSYVIGFFLDGNDAQFPMVLGTFHKMPNMDPNLSDVNVLARGTNKIVKKLTGPEPESPYRAQYPKNQVFESKTGHVIEIDDTDGDERIHVYHRKGTYVEIDRDGRIVIKSVDSSIDVTDKKKTIYAKDVISIESEKSVEIKAKDNIVLKAKNVKISGGNSSINMANGVFGVDSGNVRVKGDYVNVSAPSATVAGASISSGRVNAKGLTSPTLTSDVISSKTTGGLSQSVADLTKTIKSVSLSGGTVGSLTSELNKVFGDMKGDLVPNVPDIQDAVKTQVSSVVKGISGIRQKMDSALGLLDGGFDSVLKQMNEAADELKLPKIDLPDVGELLGDVIPTLPINNSDE